MTHPHWHIDRRAFLQSGSFSLGPLALAMLLRDEGLLAAPTKPPVLQEEIKTLEPRQPQAPAQAKAMISLFMQGGPSQVDLFDPKP
ncbi:MAG: DUF1501 domain-containing protein, partial [Planctomycetaceae bacterium]|nr:DUF1501 domain-containing protein [Planctomycetaceae bacterium]